MIERLRKKKHSSRIQLQDKSRPLNHVLELEVCGANYMGLDQNNQIKIQILVVKLVLRVVKEGKFIKE